MMLINVFRSPELVCLALEEYDRHYLRKWPLSNKILLYNYARTAFDPGQTNIYASEAFSYLYNDLWIYWKLYRGSSVVNHWSSEEALVRLRGVCSPWEMKHGLTLASLKISSSREELQECFDAFAGIKKLTSGNYPWVAASKFLHFLNPSLFPIYDIGEVWNVSLNGCFKSDYRLFCQKISAKPGELSSVFNCTYTALAAEMIQNAHPEMMRQFADWFRKTCGKCVDDHNVLGKIDTYYATAFEMIMLGAKKIA